MIFRLLGICLFPLCGWIVGDLFQEKINAHLLALRRTIELFCRIRQEIAFRRTDLGTLCGKLKSEGKLPRDVASLQSLKFLPGMTEEEAACFTECMAALGRTQAEQECERLEYYIARFEEWQVQAQQAARTQAGLPHRLGFAAGAVLALVFL